MFYVCVKSTVLKDLIEIQMGIAIRLKKLNKYKNFKLIITKRGYSKICLIFTKKSKAKSSKYKEKRNLNME